MNACEHTKYLVEKYLSKNRRNEDIDATVESKIRSLSFVASAWEQAAEKVSLTKWLQGEFILVLGRACPSVAWSFGAALVDGALRRGAVKKPVSFGIPGLERPATNSRQKPRATFWDRL